MEDILKNMAGIEIEISERNGVGKATVRTEYFKPEGKTRKISNVAITNEQVKEILKIILKEED